MYNLIYKCNNETLYGSTKWRHLILKIKQFNEPSCEGNEKMKQINF